MDAVVGRVYNYRVAMKHVGGTFTPNSGNGNPLRIQLKLQEGNTACSSINSTANIIFGPPATFSANVDSADLILSTKSINHTVVNANSQSVQVALEVLDNYNGANINFQLRAWGQSLVENLGYNANVTAVPLFPTLVLPPHPVNDFWRTYKPLIKSADDISITSPTVTQSFTNNQMFYIKGITPHYIHSSGGAFDKTAMSWDDNTTGNNGVQLIARDTSNNTVLKVFANSATPVATLSLGALDANGKFSVAFTVNSTVIAASLNGGAVVQNTYSATPRDLSIIKIGRGFTGSNTYLCGTIKVLQFAKQSASNAELIALSSNTGNDIE